MSEAMLIDLVKQNKLLYDPSAENYSNAILKASVWNHIAKKLGADCGSRVKNSWLRLRGSYRDARRRQLRFAKRGIPSQVIKPWRLQEEMSFLENFISTIDREISPEIESVRKETFPNILRGSKTNKKEQLLDSNSKIITDDPLFHFFKSMYLITKTLPQDAQLTVKRELYEAVAIAEEIAFKEGNRLLPSLQNHCD